MILSYRQDCNIFQELFLKGKLEVEFNPQGTLVERLRAAGAGIPAFYTRTGYGTLIEKGGAPQKYDEKGQLVQVSKPKPTKEFKGKGHILEEALEGDVAFVKAWRADSFGNLQFQHTAMNYNPDCAKAAKFTIVEVDEIVDCGTFDPSSVHLPGIYVDAIVQSTAAKRFEKLKLSNGEECKSDAGSVKNKREVIAHRAALEFQNGWFVNLGVGIPTLAANFVPENIKVTLQCENGLLGTGPYPKSENEANQDLINAGKETVTYVNESSVFSSSESFAMIRGGHINMTMLGALECSSKGDLANWIIPGKLVKGMGGAMDLVSGSNRTVVCMEHVDKYGNSKIKEKCDLPVTGAKCVNRIITDLCVFDVDLKNGCLTLIELQPNISLEQVQNSTQCDFQIRKGDLQERRPMNS